MNSPGFHGPVNIGSDEMISINSLAKMVMKIAGKNSDNKLIKEKLNWSPSIPLKIGLEKTYKWIEEQVIKSKISTDI